jgi:membrane protein required for colicin V production
MAFIDIVFAVFILVLVVRCALRGFVGEVLAWASVVLGLLTGFLLYQSGAAFLRTRFFGDLRILPEILAFAALFLIVFVFIRILESILKDIIERINLGGLDRFLGLLFGLLEGLVLVSLILFVLLIQPLFPPERVLGESLFARLLLPLIASSAESGGFLPVRVPGV